MMNPRTARLSKELEQIHSSALPSGILVLHTLGDDLTTWKALIEGPPDTPYEGGVFELSIQIGERYPFEPPLVRFVTQ